MFGLSLAISMQECQWTFDPAWWKRQFRLKTDIKRRECSLNAQFEHDGTHYCKFHCPPTTRRENGLSDKAVFYDLLEKQNDVIAPVFQTISLEDDNIINNKSNAPVDIIHPIIQDSLKIDGCRIKSKLRIIGGVVGISRGSQSDDSKNGLVEITNPKTKKEIKISDFRICGNLSGKFSSFDGSITMINVKVHGYSQIQGSFANELKLLESDFGDPVYIYKSRFEQGLSLAESTFWSSLVLVDSEISGTLDLAPIFTRYLVSFSNVEVENIDEQIRKSTDSLLKIYDSTISNGIIRQPNSGNTFFDFDRAILGDIQIVHSEDNFQQYRFVDTSFKGFRFQQIINELINSDWNLHKFNIDTVRANVEIKCSLYGPASVARQRLYTDSFNIRNNIETYIEAKRRALETGDKTSSSEFLIKEMKARQAKRSHRLSTSSISLRLRIRLRMAQLRDSALDILCAFGQKPLRIISWMILSPFVIGVTLLPAFGGVINTRTGEQYAFSLSDSFDIALIINTFLNNLYFSYASFTTVNPNQVQPASDCAHIIMLFLAFLGPFFIALFVYTLGKQIGY